MGVFYKEVSPRQMKNRDPWTEAQRNKAIHPFCIFTTRWRQLYNWIWVHWMTPLLALIAILANQISWSEDNHFEGWVVVSHKTQIWTFTHENKNDWITQNIHPCASADFCKKCLQNHSRRWQLDWPLDIPHLEVVWMAEGQGHTPL